MSFDAILRESMKEAARAAFVDSSDQVLTEFTAKLEERLAQWQASVVVAVLNAVQATEAKDEVVSATEADRRLGIRMGTVRGWALAKLIPATISKGNKLRVSMVEVRRYAAGRNDAHRLQQRDIRSMQRELAAAPLAAKSA